MNRKKLTAVFLMVVMFVSMFSDIRSAEAAEVDEVAKLVSEMTTEQKITQMLMPAFRNYDGKKVTELPQDIQDFLRKYTFGGVCLFAENFADTEQSLRLADALQGSLGAGSPQLFISADQEGGRITRINTGTQMPGNMALAATHDTENARQSAEIIGKELQSLGLNMDFAPVLDVNNNPSNPIIGLRSFSDDPETVGAFGKAYIEGLSVSDTIGTVKHFPGHGDTATDSHTGLPSISKSYDELKKLELVPYEKCLGSVDMLMTAHIQYPNIEKETYISSDGEEISLPATLSKTIITDILRKDLGYDGVVTTDAMNMDAIAKYFDRYDAAKLAINAGVDILLMPVAVEKKEDLKDFETYIDKLAQMVSAGTISEENVNKSVTRILTLKKKKGLLTPYASGDLDTRIKEAKVYVGSQENHDKEWEITKKAITLVKNVDDALPIDASAEKTVILNHDSDYTLSVAFALNRLKNTGQLKEDATVTVDTFSDKSVEEIRELVAGAKNVIMDIGIGSKAKLNPENNADIGKINDTIAYVHENGGKVTVISYSLPYDAGLYRDADAVMLAYSARGMTSLPGEFADYTVQYGANVPAALYLCMAKDESPVGVLPVDIPKLTDDYDFSDTILYKRGFGLTYKIVPKSTKITKVKGRKKALLVQWKKQTVKTDGYEIRYSTNKKFVSKKTKLLTVKNKKTTKKIIKKLKKKTTYYLQIRTYKKVGKTIYRSGWSGTKKVVTR